MSHYMTALAMKQRGLKPAAKIVLYWLADHYNETTGACFPSVSTIAHEGEMSAATVHRHLADLEDAGLIERITRQRPDGGLSSNGYILHLQPISQNERGVLAKCEGGTRKMREGPVAKCESNLVSINLVNEPGRDAPARDGAEEPTLALTPPPPSKQKPSKARKAQGDQGFAEWWARYPRKIGKGAARTAWARAIKKADTETISRALRRQAAVWVAEGTEDRFIPHPATWLNQERWDDEGKEVGVTPADLPDEERERVMAKRRERLDRIKRGEV